MQTWVEELLVKWVTNCIKKYKIPNVTISGGVALNIKAMEKISQIKEVKNYLLADLLAMVHGFKCWNLFA